MKTHIRLLLSAIMSVMALASYGGNPAKYFESLSEKDTYNYSYVSPMMLRAMADRYISTENVPVRSSDLTSIETVSTVVNGQDEALWKIIKDLKKEKKMETLSSKKQDYYRYDILARLSGDGKTITNLMVITQNGGASVDVVYMEGKIPIECLKHSNID